MNIDTQKVQQALAEAAEQYRTYLYDETGEYYETDQLVRAFQSWFLSSVEELASDAFTLCVEGDRHHASFNRRAFEIAMNKVQPVEPEDIQSIDGGRLVA